MAGLISNALTGTVTGPSPAVGNMVNAESFGIDPALRMVDAPKETVAGQLDTLLSKDSPYLQSARAGAMQTANSRGLLNSSMAAGAGESAAINAALPIAAADSATYSTASRENQGATNTGLALTADSANKAAITNAGNANTIGLQDLKGEQATTLANIEANFKTLMQSSDSAAKLFQTAQASLTAIEGDPNTSAEQKAAAVSQITQLLQSGLTVTGAIGNIDLTGLLDFSDMAAVSAQPATTAPDAPPVPSRRFQLPAPLVAPTLPQFVRR